MNNQNIYYVIEEKEKSKHLARFGGVFGDKPEWEVVDGEYKNKASANSVKKLYEQKNKNYSYRITQI